MSKSARIFFMVYVLASIIGLVWFNLSSVPEAASPENLANLDLHRMALDVTNT